MDEKEIIAELIAEALFDLISKSNKQDQSQAEGREYGEGSK